MGYRSEIAAGRGVAVLLSALVLFTAACSSDAASPSSGPSSGSGGSSASGAAAPIKASTDGTWDASGASVDASKLKCAGNKPSDDHRGITDTSIKIGGFGTVTGPTIATFGDSDKGAAARFKRANDEGGVNGRTIDYTGMTDDGLDSTRSVDGARRVAERDKVFAVAPLMTQLASYADVFCQDVVPYVGWGFNTGFCDNTVGFGFDGCLVPTDFPYNSNIPIALQQLLGANASVAFLGNDDDAARKGDVVLRAGFEKAGLKVPYAEYILPDSAPIADPSPIVNDIMTADGGQPPDAVYLVADFSNTNTMVQALKAASFPGKIVDAVGYDPRLASLPSFDDTYVQLLWAPTESREVPFVQQMVADMQKYEPDVALSLPTIAGYISADFLVTAVQKAGRDLTVSGFLAMMNTTGYTYHQAGFIADTHWPLNHSVGTPCSDLVHLKDQKYASVSGLQCTNLVPN